MADIIKILIRLIHITIAFFLSSQIAAIAFLFLSQLIKTTDFVEYGEIEMTFILLISTLSLGAHFAFVAFLPSLAGILYAELKFVQSWLYYAIFSGTLALFEVFVLGVYTTQTSNLAINCVAAMIGGVCYWLLAGRTAGNWRR